MARSLDGRTTYTRRIHDRYEAGRPTLTALGVHICRGRNPDTVEDLTWTPLLVTPPFPDYIAGHTTYADAAEKVLTFSSRFEGDDALTSSLHGGDDDPMLRALILATIVVVIPWTDAAQALSVLHIKVVVVDAERRATPVSRHVLLISDNPASAPPRRIVTKLDGTAEVSLPPGNYTVESDRPVGIQGKAYQWTQTVDIVAGRDAVLELTADNAEPVGSATTTGAALEADPSSILTEWQDSVVAVWTPTTHASGFVVDPNGLIATNQRIIGTSTSVEVQLTRAVKVTANILVADPVRDVAVLWINPTLVASLRPVALGCAQTAKPSVVSGQEIFTIGTPLRDRKDLTSGIVERVEQHAILSDFSLAAGSTGGPVFAAGGGVIGITSPVDETDDYRRGDSRVVPILDVCDVVAVAEKKMKDAAPPNGTHLPVEPLQVFPVDALKDAVQRRAGSLLPYQMSASDFDVAFITPVMVYGAEYQSEQVRERDRSRGARTGGGDPAFVRPLMEFSNWSEYVADFPPVLLVRVTPRLVEGFCCLLYTSDAADE